MTTIKSPGRKSIVSALLVFAPALWAQTSPIISAGTDAPVMLSPFTVDASRDRGYIAVDSLAGGRTNTPVKFTPSAMSSLTRTFIDDLGVTNVRDSLVWTLNAVPSDWYAGRQSSNPFNAWDYNFRGAGQSLQGGAGPMRNYFTFYQVADSYNIDRIEADRGPNSILFGVGTVGGVLSIYTKLPRLEREFVTGAGTVDNYGSYRFELDSNQVLSKTLALRLNAVVDDRRGWRKGDRDRFQALDLALLYKPVASTSLRLEVEGGKARRTLISTTFPEAVSKWDGTTSAATWGAAVSTPGVEPMKQWGPTNYNVWIAGRPELGLQDWAKGSRSGGSFLSAAPFAGWYPASMVNGAQSLDGTKLPVLPARDFTFGSGLSRPSYENVTAFLDHTFNKNFDAELSLYRYTDTHLVHNYEGLSYFSYDLNQQLPNGSINPNFGKAFGDFFLSEQRQNRSVTEYRAQLNYHFEATPFGIPLKQRFSAAAGEQNIRWRARERMAQIANATSTDWTDRMIWGRLYLDQANTSIDVPANADGREVVYAPLSFDWFDFDETYQLDSASLMSQSLLWNDRLSVLLGVRHDHYRHRKVGANSGSVVADRASGTTYSAGAIYYFLKSLGAFVNYSKNFDPIGPGKNLSLDGQPFGPATGKGYEYGLRVSTNDGKYYATLNRYDTQSAGRITTTKLDFGGIWKQYFLATGQPLDPAKTSLAYDDTEALDVTGYEFELTANPTSSLRLQAGFSKPDSKVVEAMAGQRAYFAANFATWDAVANGTSSEATTLRNLLTNGNTSLDNNLAGKTKTGLVKYTANVFATYAFLKGPIKGLAVGGGVAQTGRQYIGTIRDDKVYSSVRTIANASIAYETKYREYPIRLALNIDNVFDKREPIVTSYDGGWRDGAGNAVANGWYFQPPRLFKFSARLTF